MFTINNFMHKVVTGGIRAYFNAFIKPFPVSIHLKMSERRVVVNPRASALVITKTPAHVTVHQDGINRLKDEVKMLATKTKQQSIRLL